MIIRAVDPRFAGLLYALFYCGHYVLLGVQLPFFAGWLALHGFTAAEIGLITAVGLIGRLIIGPAIAIWADRQADERKGLVIVSGVFAIGAALLLVASSKLLISIAALLVLVGFGLLVPLTDAVVLRADRNGWLHYGRTRAVGSFAFLLTTIIGGGVLSVFGLSAAVPIMAAAACFSFLISFLLPFGAGRQGDAPAAQFGEALLLLSHPVMVLAFLAAGLTQGAHAVYYAFSYLRWSALGYSDLMIGVLWAIGVLAEIALLLSARKFIARFSPPLLMAIGAAGALLRWALTAAEPPLFALIFVQMMHALTFAIAYIGAVEFIDRAAPLRLAKTAMTLKSTIGVGAITGLATGASGFIWGSYGPAAAYGVMSAMGGVAVILALLLNSRWRGEQILD